MRSKKVCFFARLLRLRQCNASSGRLETQCCTKAGMTRVTLHLQELAALHLNARNLHKLARATSRAVPGPAAARAAGRILEQLVHFVPAATARAVGRARNKWRPGVAPVTVRAVASKRQTFYCKLRGRRRRNSERAHCRKPPAEGALSHPIRAGIRRASRTSSDAAHHACKCFRLAKNRSPACLEANASWPLDKQNHKRGPAH